MKQETFDAPGMKRVVALRAYKKAWAEANRDRCREYSRAWRRRNPEKCRLKKMNQDHRRPDLAKARNARWRANNAARSRALRAAGKRRRRLRIAASVGPHFTAAQLHAKWMRLGRCCFYCREHVAQHDYEPEHRIPLARGGSNRIGNVVPACHACNAHKHTKTDREFARCKCNRCIRRKNEAA